MKHKIKNVVMCTTPVLFALAGSIPAYASEGAFDATTLVTQGVTSVQSDLLSSITAITPVAMVIVGAVIAVKFGIRFFTQITGVKR